MFQTLKYDKHEIIIKLVAGVFFIYADNEFICSSDNWTECRQEIERWLDENGQR